MTNLFGPGLGACYAIPSQTSDAGPEDPKDTRDSADWLWVAQETAQAAARIYDDNPWMQRRRKLSAIDEAIDALKCARELVEIGG
jgi:hypothetical protein